MKASTLPALLLGAVSLLQPVIAHKCYKFECMWALSQHPKEITEFCAEYVKKDPTCEDWPSAAGDKDWLEHNFWWEKYQCQLRPACECWNSNPNPCITTLPPPTTTTTTTTTPATTTPTTTAATTTTTPTTPTTTGCTLTSPQPAGASCDVGGFVSQAISANNFITAVNGASPEDCAATCLVTDSCESFGFKFPNTCDLFGSDVATLKPAPVAGQVNEDYYDLGCFTCSSATTPPSATTTTTTAPTTTFSGSSCGLISPAPAGDFCDYSADALVSVAQYFLGTFTASSPEECADICTSTANCKSFDLTGPAVCTLYSAGLSTFNLTPNNSGANNYFDIGCFACSTATPTTTTPASTTTTSSGDSCTLISPAPGADDCGIGGIATISLGPVYLSSGPGESAEDCADLCVTVSGCESFVYDSDSPGTCNLYSVSVESFDLSPAPAESLFFYDIGCFSCATTTTTTATMPTTTATTTPTTTVAATTTSTSTCTPTLVSPAPVGSSCPVTGISTEDSMAELILSGSAASPEDCAANCLSTANCESISYSAPPKVKEGQKGRAILGICDLYSMDVASFDIIPLSGPTTERFYDIGCFSCPTTKTKTKKHHHKTTESSTTTTESTATATKTKKHHHHKTTASTTTTTPTTTASTTPSMTTTTTAPTTTSTTPSTTPSTTTTTSCPTTSTSPTTSATSTTPSTTPSDTTTASTTTTTPPSTTPSTTTTSCPTTSTSPTTSATSTSPAGTTTPTTTTAKTSTTPSQATVTSCPHASITKCPTKERVTVTCTETVTHNTCERWGKPHWDGHRWW